MSDKGEVAELRRLAAQRFGGTELTTEQTEAMAAVGAGLDVLVVLPTGAGKSAIHQVPALVLPGPTVVVSPLLALQRDQIEGLAVAAVPAAVALDSRQPAADRERVWDAIREGSAEYVFLSPEQLAKDEVVAGPAGRRGVVVRRRRGALRLGVGRFRSGGLGIKTPTLITPLRRRPRAGAEGLPNPCPPRSRFPPGPRRSRRAGRSTAPVCWC